ncbi:inward rectifier potassium channel [Prochlorococcus sp. MIT 1011]|uniref:inward rectifier potassium channel n=1 Tax=Prochlorococcus sp. MIT 1011 TaxID=3082520 RepID=UPI0039B6973D
MSLELTDLIKDFIATNLLSKVELDFLESELWETLEHIDEITSLTSAPVNISKELKLKDGSSWQLCCAAVLDEARPQKNSRTEQLRKLIEKFSLQ